MKFNSWEQTFRSVVEEAERWVSGDKELEIVHYKPESGESGWYAWEYDGNMAVPIYKNEYDKKPLISDKTAKEHEVNVVKILNVYGVYYSEC